MLGTVKGLGERALHLAGVPLRWVGTQLEQGRADAVRERTEAKRDERVRRERFEADLLAIYGLSARERGKR